MAEFHFMIQARIPRDSGLAEDVSINTWHFRRNDAVGATDTPEERLCGFYGDIDNLLSSRNASPIEFRRYNMADPEPRTPNNIDTCAIVPGSGLLPSEVAICLSFAAEPISGQPQARRRGRVFLGPLTDTTQASGVGDAAVVTAVCEQIADAAEAMMLLNDIAWDWVVYSPTDDAMHTVTNLWVDNAFDTMRSRGARATLRESRVAP